MLIRASISNVLKGWLKIHHSVALLHARLQPSFHSLLKSQTSLVHHDRTTSSSELYVLDRSPDLLSYGVLAL